MLTLEILAIEYETNHKEIYRDTKEHSRDNREFCADQRYEEPYQQCLQSHIYSMACRKANCVQWIGLFSEREEGRSYEIIYKAENVADYLCRYCRHLRIFHEYEI